MNDSIDLVNASKEGRGGKPSADSSLKFSSGLVKVRNLTGADRARGEVVQLGAHLLTNIDPHSPWFEGNTPADPVELKYAILRWPTKSNKIDAAFVSGACVARVNVTDAGHQYATPVASAHVLGSAEKGPIQLLMPPDGTGEQELWVLLNPVPRVARWFKATLSAVLESADTSASVDGVAALDGGTAPGISSVTNWLNLAGADNANVAIVEDLSGESPAYLLMGVAHIAIEVVTDVAPDDDTTPTELLKTTRTIVTMAGADDTADATIIELDDCTE